MEDQKGYSQEVREILERKPRWIIRWGILLFAGLFAAGLVGAWFIPYSNTLDLPVTIRLQEDISGGLTNATIECSGESSGFFSAGQELTILVTGRTLSPVRLRARVLETSVDTAGTACQASLALLPGQSGFQADPKVSWPATVQIETGRSNLLEQIFRPIRQIFTIRRKG